MRGLTAERPPESLQ